MLHFSRSSIFDNLEFEMNLICRIIRLHSLVYFNEFNYLLVIYDTKARIQLSSPESLDHSMKARSPFSAPYAAVGGQRKLCFKTMLLRIKASLESEFGHSTVFVRMRCSTKTNKSHEGEDNSPALRFL